MRVLVLGGGGREHTICYSLSKSPKLEKLFCIPGNGGISEIAETIENISMTDFDNIIKFCKENKIDLVIPGPEEPLVKGLKDSLNKEGIKVFGPDTIGALLEGSKSFAKEIMSKAGIPTAKFEVFDEPSKAKAYIEKKGAPIVVKADGLCAGKGVFVCETKEEAIKAIEKIMEEKIFGEAGNKVVIEEKLVGEEASYIVITDGYNFKALPTSQDHKRLLDNDEGPNTGGMGAYSPTPLIDKELKEKIEEKIIKPTLKILEKEGHPYVGFLYAGLMIVNKEPYVLEFNCRLGDPEAQAILPRVENDFLEIIEMALEKNLNKIDLKEKSESAVCVVMASKGYPGKYEKGKKIEGLEKASQIPGVLIFHAGTKKINNEFYTNGGRVLGVTALDKNIPLAIEKAYKAVSMIYFEGAHYRKDIGKKAFKYLAT
ncbi:Phosphoribosylamine--glycine ligase [Thermodesulfobacterium geofontis OPF15]|uniref:Phosphoribosylamine--glycine ligase n=1 Tax=Thermodesulfobacterium geofontis (strain OPF15) TaxID=795359 RepID=F8C4I8_THEGP|nr:phosphoribosylamine--glycine ligase [Thermodesulfobacterium geofontis]AEH23092.1 Phosphoribosylamine--glycine ligase [Thermodesulfobacterium geofontis OPF15]